MKYSLVGIDGNAFNIMGYVVRAMRECGYDNEDIKDYQDNAMSGDYNHLLSVSMEIISILNEER